MTEYVMYVKQASQTFHNVTLVQKAHLMMILQMKHNVFHVNATLMVQWQAFVIKTQDNVHVTMIKFLVHIGKGHFKITFDILF